MKQTSLKLNQNVKKTRKQVFLGQMEKVVPWAALVERSAPFYPEGKTRCPPFSLQTMLRVHFMQQWFTLSDPGMEEAFFDTLLYREFSQLDEFGRVLDESTILRFRHRLEKYKLADQILGVVNGIRIARGLLLKTGAVADATLIAAPSSAKNKGHKRDPEMRSSKRGEQMYFATIGHIEADAESRLVRSVRGTSGNVSDVTQGNSLLKGQESVAFGDAGYQGIEKRSDANESVTGHAARRPGKRRALNKENAAEALIDKTEKMKASNLAKVEHPFRVVKRQFRFVELRKSSLVKARNGTLLKACA
jgi:IS5 family transposase